MTSIMNKYLDANEEKILKNEDFDKLEKILKLQQSIDNSKNALLKTFQNN